MAYNYDEWSEKHRDTIALCIGAVYAIILITFAVIVYIYAE